MFSNVAVSVPTLGAAPAWTDDYQDATNAFKKAAMSSKCFDTAYGYALFPTIVKGGAMYEVSVSGQKFKYTPKAAAKAKVK